MQQEIAIALIGAISLICGALIGISGQFVGNWLNHKKKLDYLVFETFFKRRQDYLERLGIEMEKLVERHAQIIYYITNINNKIGNKKITRSLVKKNVTNILLEINKEKMQNFKPAGSSIYFSDTSPLIGKISVLALQYPNTLLFVRKAIDNNFYDQNIILEMNRLAQQDILNAKLLLDEVRRELLFRKIR